MSNYFLQAKNKSTGIIVELVALDDYFGKHAYGYKISDGRVLNQLEFDSTFTILNEEIIKDWDKEASSQSETYEVLIPADMKIMIKEHISEWDSYLPAVKSQSIEVLVSQLLYLVENSLKTEVAKILKKEKATWANQSIGYKAVESVEKALLENKIL